MDDLRDAIERTLEGIFNQSGDSLVVLGGDFNKLQDEYFLSLGLLVEFNDATHAGHSLDRIYASEHVYSSCYAFDAIVKTSHKAVVVRADGVKIDTHKIKRYITIALENQIIMQPSSNI